MTQDHDGQTKQPAPRQPSPGPADVLRDTNLKASIWRNEGESGPYYATTFSRFYRDKDGEFRESQSFVAADLLKLSRLADKAYERTGELRREDREQARATFRENRAKGAEQDRESSRDR